MGKSETVRQIINILGILDRYKRLSSEVERLSDLCVISPHPIVHLDFAMVFANQISHDVPAPLIEWPIRHKTVQEIGVHGLPELQARIQP